MLRLLVSLVFQRNIKMTLNKHYFIGIPKKNSECWLKKMLNWEAPFKRNRRSLPKGRIKQVNEENYSKRNLETERCGEEDAEDNQRSCNKLARKKTMLLCKLCLNKYSYIYLICLFTKSMDYQLLTKVFFVRYKLYVCEIFVYLKVSEGIKEYCDA